MNFWLKNKFMRNLFPEFNKPTTKGFKKLWTEAIFVFDTNILLSLYRIPQQARIKMISVLKELEKQNRVWIPHQVATEFYRKRIDVIHAQEKSHNEILEVLNKTEQDVVKRFDSREIVKKIAGSCKVIRGEIEKSKKRDCDWLKKDKIETELNKIFKNKVGKAYDSLKLNEIYKNGQDRYDKEIPPGYEDKKKDKDDKTGTRKFGDLIIWFQIIEQAKTDKKPIILVTDEQKEDWWWKINGTTTIGPRYELRKEIKEQSGIEFYMYQSEQFMKHAGEYLKVKFDKNLIEQVKKSKEEHTQSQNELSVSSTDNIGLSEEVKVSIDPIDGNSTGSENSLSAEVKRVDNKQVGGEIK